MLHLLLLVLPLVWAGYSAGRRRVRSTLVLNIKDVLRCLNIKSLTSFTFLICTTCKSTNVNDRNVTIHILSKCPDRYLRQRHLYLHYLLQVPHPRRAFVSQPLSAMLFCPDKSSTQHHILPITILPDSRSIKHRILPMTMVLALPGQVKRLLTSFSAHSPW